MREIEAFGTATKFRDMIRKFIQAEVERLRPRYRYAEVISVVDANHVEIQFPGEPASVVIPVFNQNISVGATVKVIGNVGDRHVLASGGGGGGPSIWYEVTDGIPPTITATDGMTHAWLDLGDVG